MNYKPKVSIIINCYNGAEFLEKAINSVICQTYNNWELIFWDNVSTDESSIIFQKYKDDRFHYFQQEAIKIINEYCTINNFNFTFNLFLILLPLKVHKEELSKYHNF